MEKLRTHAQFLEKGLNDVPGLKCIQPKGLLLLFCLLLLFLFVLIINLLLLLILIFFFRTIILDLCVSSYLTLFIFYL